MSDALTLTGCQAMQRLMRRLGPQVIALSPADVTSGCSATSDVITCAGGRVVTSSTVMTWHAAVVTCGVLSKMVIRYAVDVEGAVEMCITPLATVSNNAVGNLGKFQSCLLSLLTLTMIFVTMWLEKFFSC